MTPSLGRRQETATLGREQETAAVGRKQGTTAEGRKQETAVTVPTPGAGEFPWGHARLFRTKTTSASGSACKDFGPI